jgi:glutaminase
VKRRYDVVLVMPRMNSSLKDELGGSLALLTLSMFNAGAITVTSLHLGFDIEGPLTESQASKFHEFVKPLLVKKYARIKEDKAKVAEFESLYSSTMPDELLTYLLKDELSLLKEEIG